jgi:hypothetical protein
MRSEGWAFTKDTLSIGGGSVLTYTGLFSGDYVYAGVFFIEGKLECGVIFYKGGNYSSVYDKYRRNLSSKYGDGSGFLDLTYMTGDGYVYLQYEYQSINLLYMSHTGYKALTGNADKDADKF